MIILAVITLGWQVGNTSHSNAKNAHAKEVSICTSSPVLLIEVYQIAAA